MAEAGHPLPGGVDLACDVGGIPLNRHCLCEQLRALCGGAEDDGPGAEDSGRDSALSDRGSAASVIRAATFEGISPCSAIATRRRSRKYRCSSVGSRPVSRKWK